MQVPSAIAAGSVAIALFAGGFAVGHGISDDNGSKSSDKQASQATTTSSSTTSTTVPGVPQAPPTSQAPTPTPTTAKPATTPATAAPSTQQAAVVTNTPATTPATVVVGPECGTGTASAQLSIHTQPTSPTANTDYQTDVFVDVSNGMNKAIQLDNLSVRLTLENGQTSDVTFTKAPGTVIEAGQTGRFTAVVNTGKSPTKSAALSSFAFHTAGHPECPGRAP